MTTTEEHHNRDQRYVALSLLAGATVVMIFIALAYKDKMERWLKALHEKHRKM